MSARHYARLGAVQFLYWQNLRDQSQDESDEQCLIDLNVLQRGDLAYLQKLIRSIPPRIPQLQSILRSAIDRDLKLVDQVEYAILLLGIYELKFEHDIPPKVVTNECIELSREFGNPDSYRFINGTLDKLAFNRGGKLRSSAKPSKHNTKVQVKQSVQSREAELIEQHFKRSQKLNDGVVLGIGDDCAVLKVPEREELIVSTDSLLSNVHFPQGTAAEDIGFKSLAVSLSDLAAMGAKPAYATLNLSMPSDDKQWLQQFSRGFFELADAYNVALVGGDTVRGPLNIAVTLLGFAKSGESILRSGAVENDFVYVTGTLGDAALGLTDIQRGFNLSNSDAEYIRRRLNRPTPRVNAGQVLRKIATSAIDLSDGLITDLSRILEASQVGAKIWLDWLPLSATYRKLFATVGWDYALAKGDDYELCFTVAQHNEGQLLKSVKAMGVHVQKIGYIQKTPKLEFIGADGSSYGTDAVGYSHF